MPIIKDYTANPLGTGVPQGRQATGSDIYMRGDEATGRALSDLGETGMKVSRQLQEGNEQRDLVNAYKEAAQARLRIRERLDVLKQQGASIGDSFGESLDAELGPMYENRRTERGRLLVEQTTASIRTEVGHEIREYDSSLAGVEAKDAGDAIARENGIALQKNPDMLPNIIAEQKGFVDALTTVSPDVRRDVLRDLNTSAARNAGEGLIRINPSWAKEKISGGYLDKYITADDREELLRRADVQINGLEAQTRIEKAEAEHQQQLTANDTMIDALIRVHATDPKTRLTAAGVTALALQTFPDGHRVLADGQVKALYAEVEALANGETVTTSHEMALYVVPRLQTMTEEELIKLKTEGRMANADFERWMGEINEGNANIRNIRDDARRSIIDVVGISPQMAAFTTGTSRLILATDALMHEREAEYRKAGKNPIDYYSSGEYEKDVKYLGGRFNLIEAGEQNKLVDMYENIKVGDVRNGLRYKGGDIDDMNNWVDADIPYELAQ